MTTLTLKICLAYTAVVQIFDYLGVLVLLILGLGAGVGAISGAYLLGSRRCYPQKLSPYECGIPSEGAANQRYSVKFYLVAVSFIVFDIETAFLVPWALSFQSLLAEGHGLYILTVGLFFLFLVTIGLVYEWRKGLLDWNN